MKKFVLYASTAAFTFLAVPAFAECISLTNISESPIIDNKTILVSLKGSGFKRIDLTGGCSSLTWDGFARSSPSNAICTADILQALGPTRGSCVIDNIVTIDATEAAALRAQKNKR